MTLGQRTGNLWISPTVISHMGTKKSSGFAVSKFKVIEILDIEKLNLSDRPVPFLFLCVPSVTVLHPVDMSS